MVNTSLSNAPLKVGNFLDISLEKNSYFLTRIVILRALSFVYGIAFLVAKHQAKALIGDDGIAPARVVLDQAQKKGQEIRRRRAIWLNSTASNRPMILEDPSVILRLKNLPKVRQLGMKLNRNPQYQLWRERLWDRSDSMGRLVTTLLWLADDRQKLNPWLDWISNCGLAVSFVVFILGAANLPLLLVLWICQRSIMAVGGTFWSYGWEPQLAELGFHALFLVPLFSLNPVSHTSPPSALVLFAIRWHLFRIMMGAGLIKMKSGDKKWRWPNLSTMSYFYETQPVPNPLTRYFHWMPPLWHKGEVLINHFVELIAPWLLLAPFASTRRLGGLIQVIFQLFLISSGNLSFLNWLTAVPAIACFDDAYLRVLFPQFWWKIAIEAASNSRRSPLRDLVSFTFACLIGRLSIPVVKNLLSKRQVMNGSFGPLRLINTYGAFGSVQEDRLELIVSAAPNLDGPWKEYEFKVKPGNVFRTPRFISPYHYRIDWQFWIAAMFPDLEYSPWIYSFLLKLLKQDPAVLALLEHNPFEGDSEAPKFIRIDKYRYEFFRRKKDDRRDQPEQYWTREYIGRVFPKNGIATVDSLNTIVDGLVP